MHPAPVSCRQTPHRIFVDQPNRAPLSLKIFGKQPTLGSVRSPNKVRTPRLILIPFVSHSTCNAEKGEEIEIGKGTEETETGTERGRRAAVLEVSSDW